MVTRCSRSTYIKVALRYAIFPISTEMGNRLWAGEPCQYITRSIQPGHPSVGGHSEYQRKPRSRLNRHTTWCISTSPVPVISQSKLVNGWGKNITSFTTCRRTSHQDPCCTILYHIVAVGLELLKTTWNLSSLACTPRGGEHKIVLTGGTSWRQLHSAIGVRGMLLIMSGLVIEYFSRGGARFLHRRSKMGTVVTLSL